MSKILKPEFSKIGKLVTVKIYIDWMYDKFKNKD